jgi:hypothetical protein
VSLCQTLLVKDRFRAAGYPTYIDLYGISEFQQRSLIGEAMSLPCIGSLLYAAFLCKENPYWAKVCTAVEQPEVKLEPSIPKRRRKVGGVNS